MSPKKVFISYSHDSPEHAAKVAGLAASLRRDGVDCQIDLYVEGSPPEQWPLWMESKLEWAQFVLVVCTETYQRRVKKEEPPGKGLGATWEAHLIYLHLYENHLFNAKFIPVIFQDADRGCIPFPLRGGSRYLLDNQRGYDSLYATITGQHTPLPPIGEVKTLGQRTVSPSFEEPGREAAETAKGALRGLRLKSPPVEPYPEDPYPLLRPYKHPDLFAGREGDLDALAKLLTEDAPILGLFSSSGAGKSSLLCAGLMPRFRQQGHAVAYTAYPTDRRLAGRLLDEMLEWEGDKTFSDDDPEAFREAVRSVHTMSGHPAALILDQFEDVMDAGEAETRDRVGRLLTATIEERSFCRWVLGYRHEYHGQVVEWLQDAFRGGGVAWRGRFQVYPLKPLGDPESLQRCTDSFLSAITAPLGISADKHSYKLSFRKGAALRLAAAFAETRRQRPKTPLLPELQVVLHHLIENSAGSEIRVPDNPKDLIATALRDHLRRAVEEVGESHQRRAEVLLVLRELATEDRQRAEGYPVSQLETVLGQKILDKLCDQYRILYRETHDGRSFYHLSHDRIAEAVLEELEDPRIQEWLDEKVVELRTLVERLADLFEVDSEKATLLTPLDFKRISDHAAVLLPDARRKRWWERCVARNSERLAEVRRDFTRTESHGPALVALAELSGRGFDSREMADLLKTRPDLARLFEHGPAGVLEQDRNRSILAAANAYAALFPVRINNGLDDCGTELGAILWALDYGPSRNTEESIARSAREVRRAIVSLLRKEFPTLPDIAQDDWAFIEGGSFDMGSDASDARDDERPVHNVELDSFRLLKHQVTNLEFSRLFVGWADDAKRKPRHPATGVNWHQAYVFAAWLGGRLPTEAEWEFAARSRGKRRRYPWGDESHDIAERAVVAEGDHSQPMPVGSKPKGNTEQGVCDMAGNVWEWVADWYAPYSSDTQRNPWGPVGSPSGDRVVRGGSYVNPAGRARVSYRVRNGPWSGNDDLGFRVVVPVPPRPSNRDH